MKRYLLTLGLGVLLGAILLAGVLVARAFGFSSRQVPAEPAASFALDTAAAVRLAGALRIPTVSLSDSTPAEGPAFPALHAYLERSFPRAHAALEHVRRTVDDPRVAVRAEASPASRPRCPAPGRRDGRCCGGASGRPSRTRWWRRTWGWAPRTRATTRR